MAAVSKGYGVGDTVYVFYKDHATLKFLPQSRVVKNVDVVTGTNTARVYFNEGEPIDDGASAAQRVFTTQALCANKIIDDVISEYDACAVLNSTTSGVSTAGQATLGLVRSSA
jgi:hypothetical protein